MKQNHPTGNTWRHQLALLMVGLAIAAGCSPGDDIGTAGGSDGGTVGTSTTTPSDGPTGGGNDAVSPPVAAPTELPFSSAGGEAADPTGFGLPTTGDDGKSLDTIAALERAVEYYDRILRTRVAESEEEEKYFKPVPPLTDLQQLVQYRVIRAVPAGPNGQRYVYDAQTGKVKLASP
jgi:hypothetical protein